MLIISNALCVALLVALAGLAIARRRERAAFRARLAQCRKDVHEMEKIYVEAPLGLAMLDRDLRYLRINRLLADINGVGIEEHIGKSLWDIVPGLAAQVEQRFVEVMNTGKPMLGVVLGGETMSQPGVERFWRENVYPIFAPDGTVTGVNVTVEEVTREKRLNDALQESERRERARAAELEALMNAVPAGIFMTGSPTCEQVTGNEEARHILRMRAGEGFSLASPGEHSYTLHRYGKACAGESLPLQRAAAGVAVRGEEFEARFEDGESVHILVNATPLTDAGGRPAGAVSSFVDITAQKRAAAVLQEDSQRKDQFIATLAHELRNPLAAIRTALDLMKISPPESPAIPRTREIMDRQLGHLVRLIDDLLDVTRINTGKLELTTEPVAIRAVIENALQVCASTIASCGHALDVQIAPEPCYVRVDRVRIEQVLTNLLSNAAKYTPARGHIRVTVQAEGEQAVVRIADNGIGIDAATMPALFEVFSQAESGRTMRRGGVGIGLSLARKLVTLHGGTLSADSPGTGQGSTFTIRLPLCAVPAGVPVHHGEADGPAASEGRRILVVEDHLDIAQSFAALLVSCGHHVELAHTGAAALARARSLRPEIVFLDLGLPDMSGFDVAHALRQDEALRGFHLIAVTGWGADKDKAATRRAGFDMHLTKPVDIDTIRRVLSGLPAPAAPVMLV